MNNGAATAIEEMATFFLPFCADGSTMAELKAMAGDKGKWRKGHELFRRIRSKTLRADASENVVLQAQYSFEEICAKALYNMSLPERPFSSSLPAPFDEDSPFWVLPLAVQFARVLGIEDPYSVSSTLRLHSE